MAVIPLLFLLILTIMPSEAGVQLQCPATIIDPATGQTTDPNVVCKALAAGDGFITMADGRVLYIFGFSDVTQFPASQFMDEGMLAANFSGPTLSIKEGQDFYLTLTNVGMVIRPDLFDPHTVHFHGYPNAASVFDGEPMASIAIAMGASLTYYYTAPPSGTYMYHCHVEATEHMQMGMLANLYVRPAQDGTNIAGFTKFAYNDGDGSTGYDVDFPIQIVSMDPNFHDADETIQPLPFAAMTDVYPMLNGRGYPDTVNPNPLPPPVDGGTPVNATMIHPAGVASQKVNSVIQATAGQKILLRISSLATVDFYTLRVLGIPMKVVGRDAKILRGPTGNILYYNTNSVTLGGGESADVILDTTGILPGTYFLYTTNLNNLSNNTEDFGGMMTEIVIN